MTTLSIHSPLQAVFWSKNDSLIKQSLLVMMGVLILALASQISIPLTPVPLTLQSTAVIFIGMIYGARLGTYTVAAYLLAGALGLPLFQNAASGITPFFGATAGYLVGFLPAAFLSGYLAEKGWANHFATTFLAAYLGTLIIFISGVVVLAQLIGWPQAFLLGAAPFMISEPLKLLAVSFAVPKFWKKYRAKL